MEYAFELWEGELNKQDKAALEGIQYKFAKAALGIPSEMNPSAVGVRMEQGWSLAFYPSNFDVKR